MGTALMLPLGVETPLLIQDGGSVLSLNQGSSEPEVFFSLQGDLSFKTEVVPFGVLEIPGEKFSVPSLFARARMADIFLSHQYWGLMSLDRVTHGTELFSDVHKWETAVLPSFGDAVCFSSVHARARMHTHVSYQNAVRKKNQILYTTFPKGDTQKRASTHRIGLCSYVLDLQSTFMQVYLGSAVTLTFSRFRSSLTTAKEMPAFGIASAAGPTSFFIVFPKPLSFCSPEAILRMNNTQPIAF